MKSVLSVALLTLGIVLGGCAVPDETQPTTGPPKSPAPSTDFRNMTWAPGAFEGNVALQVQLRATKTDCDARVAATGLMEGPSRPMLVAREDRNGKRFSFMSGQTDLNGGSAWVGGSAQGNQVSPDTDQYPFQWAAHMEDRLELEGHANLTVAVAGLHADPNGPPFWADSVLQNNTLHVAITCDGPVEWAYLGSRNAVMFGEASMNGTGAWAQVVFDPNGATRAYFEANVSDPVGQLYLDAGGDLLLNRVGAGTVEIATPAGEETWVLRPRQILVDQVAGLEEPDKRQYSDGPGAYSVLLTYTSTATAVFDGCLLALAPIDSLSVLEGNQAAQA